MNALSCKLRLCDARCEHSCCMTLAMNKHLCIPDREPKTYQRKDTTEVQLRGQMSFIWIIYGSRSDSKTVLSKVPQHG